MGGVGVLLVLVKDDFLNIIDRDPEAGVLAPGLFKAVLKEFDVDQLADQWSGDRLDRHRLDLLFHFNGDNKRDLRLELGLPDQCVDYPVAIPGDDIVGRGPNKDRQVGRFFFPLDGRFSC